MAKGFYSTAKEGPAPVQRIFVEIAVGTDPDRIKQIELEIDFALHRCGLTHSGQIEPLDAFRRKWNKEINA